MRIGVDCGGTKIEVVALDDQGTQLFRKRVPTPRSSYVQCLEVMADLVISAEAATGLKGSIGLGIPGSISPSSGLVRNANMTWLNGEALDKDLSKILERPVRVQNDANCFAVSEAIDGAGAGSHLVFAIILGTGCGSGIAQDGKALTGHQAIAGEIGHIPLPWMTKEEFPGVSCWCGRQACLESYVSGTGFERDFAHVSGRKIAGSDIIAGANQGDIECEHAFERYKDRLARGIAMICNILDPDVVVLGGGMSNVDRLYTELPALIETHIFSDAFDTPVRKAIHGDSSGVRGAAWLWNE
ncbi:MAG: fructokinase [Stappiaceae bacterium]